MEPELNRLNYETKIPNFRVGPKITIKNTTRARILHAESKGTKKHSLQSKDWQQQVAEFAKAGGRIYKSSLQMWSILGLICADLILMDRLCFVGTTQVL